MSNEEIITTTTIVYDVRGIDKSVRDSQSLLFTVNALRLGIEDYKRLTEDPSFSNFLWTGIQLTRIWTNLLRLVKRTTQAQRFGLLQGAVGRGGATRTAAALGRAGIPTGAFGLGTAAATGATTTAAKVGLLSVITGFAAANPLVAAGLIAGVITTGFVANDVRQRRLQREWIKRQAEIAKSQGLVY